MNSLKAVCSRLAFSAAVYQIWAKRNAIIFLGLVKTEDQIGELIRKQVKSQIEGGMPYACSIINQEFCYIWGFADSVLKMGRPCSVLTSK